MIDEHAQIVNRYKKLKAKISQADFNPFEDDFV
jgi:hypothetical protein